MCVCVHVQNQTKLTSKVLHSSCSGKLGKEQSHENYAQLLIVLNPGYHSTFKQKIFKLAMLHTEEDNIVSFQIHFLKHLFIFLIL